MRVHYLNYMQSYKHFRSLSLIAFCAVTAVYGQSVEMVPCSLNGSFTCPSGFQCRSELFITGNNQSSLAYCVACQFGQYCPEGTMNIDNVHDFGNCDAGSVCPTPDSIESCEAGTFCPEGSFIEIPCTSPGTYCEMESSNFIICPEGSYCPTPATLLECPEGHFCKEAYIEPTDCAWLGSCPAGSTAPNVVGRAVLFIAIFGFVVAVFHFNLRKIDKKQQSLITQSLQRQIKETSLVNALLQHITGHDYDVFTFKGFSSKKNRVTIGFRNLSLTLKDGRKVLNNVSGEFRNSTISAVMGPSGSGKSTFLNVLTGKATYGSMTGKVFVNGFRGSIAEFRHQIGFVPQDDICYSNLTVRENLLYNARLRLPKGTGEDQIQSIVDDVLTILGMTHVQHSVVGSVEQRGVSGGQRKRVNIGMELCAYPDVLFLDEPTSGLDATASLEILGSLREIARLGVTVIAVIHQPRYSLFQLFDDVLLLGLGGNTVYLGRTDRCEAYFKRMGFVCPSNENPADFYSDVISGSVRRQDFPTFKPSDLFALWKANNDLKVRIFGSGEQEERVLMDMEMQQMKKSPDRIFTVSGSGVNLSKKNINALLSGEHQSSVQEAKDDFDIIFEDNYDYSAIHSGLTEEYFDAYAISELDSFEDKMEEVIENLPDEDAKFIELLPVHFDLLRAAFRRFDTTDSGTLCRDEIRVMMKSFGSDISDEDIETLFQALGMKDNEEITFRDLSLRIEDTKRKIVKQNMRRTLASDTASVLSPRVTPGFTAQFLIFLQRGLIQFQRDIGLTIFDFGLLVFSATIIGFVYGTDWELGKFQLMIMLTTLLIGMVATNSSLRVFGNDRIVFWREASAGISISAFFLSKNVLGIFNLIAYPLVYTTVLFNSIVPLAAFRHYYLAYLLVFWANSGLGMILSTILSPTNALLAAVVTPLITGGFFSGVFPPLIDLSSFFQKLTWLSYSRWSTEMISIRESQAYPSHISTDFLFQVGLNRDGFMYDVLGLLTLGIIFRMLAYLGLMYANKDKRQ